MPNHWSNHDAATASSFRRRREAPARMQISLRVTVFLGRGGRRDGTIVDRIVDVILDRMIN